MKQTTTLGRFFASSMAWFLALTLAWVQVSAWTSYPVAAIAHVALFKLAPDWVRTVHKSPGQLQVDTRLRIEVPDPVQGTRRVEVSVDANPSTYSYGLPLFLALLLASRSQHLLRRALAGYLILLIPQAYSLIFAVFRQIIATAGSAAALGIDYWQMQTIILAGMFGSLLLPTLAPVALWFWFDRRFFAAVIMDGWLKQTLLK